MFETDQATGHMYNKLKWNIIEMRDAGLCIFL